MAANGHEPVALATSAPSSPKTKVKFLCSHGGKILPRPADGHLKYVGGETRVISVPRNIDFSELMKKLSTMCEGDMILKYQMAIEDLDALVSVKSDEDLKHMLEEHDRHQGEGTPRLRTFLSPSVPTVIETPPVTSADPRALEQRYIDAVNGIVRMNPSPSQTQVLPKANGLGTGSLNRATFSISSACSSPKSPSPDSIPGDITLQESASSMRGWVGSLQMQHPLHKVHSSPSLQGLGNNPSSHVHGPGNGSAPLNPQYYYSPHHHHQVHHHSHQLSSQFGPYHHPRPLQVEPSRWPGPERLMAASPIGRVEIGKSPLNQGMGHCYPFSRNNRDRDRAGASSNYGYADEYGTAHYRRLERCDSVPISPRKTAWEGQCYKGEQS